MFETLDPYIGPAAGVATALLWTATSLFFTAASKRIGPVAVNTFRILLAIVFLGLTLRAAEGVWLPDVQSRQIALLALSGVVGLTLGDQALFYAFIDIGPRVTMLVATTAPLMAALFGWIALGETLAPVAWLGILLTLAGVGWVVLERPAHDDGYIPANRARGVVLAFIGAACQAGGLLLSKQGIGHGWLPEEQHMSALGATLLRMIFAGLGMIPIVALHRWHTRRPGIDRTGTPRNRRASGLALAACGAIVGPYLGVWMSLVAGDRTSLGVAQTLMSLAPIFLLPCVAVLYRERISARAVLGAFVAVGGSALLFVRAE